MVDLICSAYKKVWVGNYNTNQYYAASKIPYETFDWGKDREVGKIYSKGLLFW